jgi:hypothetical protein
LLDVAEPIFAAVTLCLAVCFVITMFLPSIRRQFAEENREKE